MNLKNIPPVFVPEQYWAEMEKLSKAALMDLVWDFATRCVGGDESSHYEVMDEIRNYAEVVVSFRKG